MNPWGGGLGRLGRAHGVVCSGAVAILVVLPACPSAEWSAALQSGITYTGYNELRVPRDGANYWAKFSVAKVLDPDSEPFVRALVRHRFARRHELSFELSLLRARAGGHLLRPVSFGGEYFQTGICASVSYHLNHYRLVYRYLLWRTPKFAAGLGLAANVTDALVRFEGEGEELEAQHWRFAALLSLGLRWRPVRRFEAVLDCNAYQLPTPAKRATTRKAPQDRTEDVTLTVGYVHKGGTKVAAGYRLVSSRTWEPEIYNFALMHQMVVGIALGL